MNQEHEGEAVNPPCCIADLIVALVLVVAAASAVINIFARTQ